MIEDLRGDVWLVSQRGLLHLNQTTGQISRPAATSALNAYSAYEDQAGNLWMLSNAPIVGLVKYDPRADRATRYALETGADGGVRGSTANGAR